MTLHVGDKVIHRVYGRAVVRQLHFDPSMRPQASIRVIGERAYRRVWLHDCEKEPAPLVQLRLVR